VDVKVVRSGIKMTDAYILSYRSRLSFLAVVVSMIAFLHAIAKFGNFASASQITWHLIIMTISLSPLLINPAGAFDPIRHFLISWNKTDLYRALIPAGLTIFGIFSLYISWENFLKVVGLMDIPAAFDVACVLLFSYLSFVGPPLIRAAWVRRLDLRDLSIFLRNKLIVGIECLILLQFAIATTIWYIYLSFVGIGLR
jgi:hypothetical protein